MKNQSRLRIELFSTPFYKELLLLCLMAIGMEKPNIRACGKNYLKILVTFSGLVSVVAL